MEDSDTRDDRFELKLTENPNNTESNQTWSKIKKTDNRKPIEKNPTAHPALIFLTVAPILKPLEISSYSDE